MSVETVLSHARIVTDDEVVRGSLLLREGRIAAIDPGPSDVPGALDCAGDYLIPGMVELHTDNLDRHIAPRPKVHWPAEAAVIAHDSQIAMAGITTVFDAVAVGDILQDSDRLATLEAMADGIASCERQEMLRVEHFLHLRCEISHANLLEYLKPLAHHPSFRLLSLMDHTPGQRQFTSLASYEHYFKSKYRLDDAQLAAFVARCRMTKKALDGQCTAAYMSFSSLASGPENSSTILPWRATRMRSESSMISGR
jgi:alpha-D-ribose 1-methylphosphonate 5-triphosphate diphosphatase